MPLVSRGESALPPPGWLGALLALGLLAALLPGGEPRRRDAAIAAAIGVAASAAFLEPGLLLGHDTIHHIWGAWAWQQAWHGGDLWPIWLHHLGLGQPLPLFYGPLPFWAMAPFALAGGGPALLLHGSFVLAAIVAALGAWWALAGWTGDRRSALVGAVAWSYAPYRLLDAGYRGALGESWALALLPLVLAGFDRALTRTDGRAAALAATGLAALALAHPLSLLLLAGLLPVYGALRLASRSGSLRARLFAAARAAAAAAAGLALAGFFLLPLAVERGSLDLTASLRDGAATRYSGHGLRPAQLVERPHWDALRWSIEEVRESPERREMPFYTGLVLLAALGVAALVGARRPHRDSPLLALAGTGACGVLLALSAARGVERLLPVLGTLQYSWRWLGPASAAAALALGLLARSPAGGRPAFALAAACALAAFGDGFAFSGAVGRMLPWQGLSLPGLGLHASGEVRAASVPAPWPLRVKGIFLPPWRCCADVAEISWSYPEYVTPRASAVLLDAERAGAAILGYDIPQRLDPEPYARRVAHGGRVRALEFRRGGGAIEVALPRGRAGRVVVLEQYFPGWRVRVDDEPGWREVQPGDRGLLEVEVPAGARRVRFRFDRWRWDRSAGWLLTAASGLLLGALARRDVPGRAKVR